MGIFFKKETMYICPEVNGKITFEGRPYAHKKIMLMLSYNKEKFVHTETDENGYFHFDEGIIKSSMPHRSLHITIAHAIYTEINEEKYMLWFAILPGAGQRKIKKIANILENLEGDFYENKPNNNYEFSCEEYQGNVTALSVLDLKIDSNLFI